MLNRQDFSVCEGKYSNNQAIVLVPGIFTQWQQPDPLTYVFTVRKGVLWPAIPPMNRTDREVTAEDIAWFLGITKQEGILKNNFALVKEFQATDRYTLKVVMQEPQADLLTNMAHTSMGIFSKECYAEKDCLGSKLISPGPFLIKESVPRQKGVFERNPEFHLKGMPYYDRIVLLEITDPSAQLAAFTTGKYDQYFTNSFTQAKEIAQRNQGVQLHASGGIGGVSTMMRPFLSGPLADVRVRRAMAMVIDHPTMWEAAVEGFSLFPTVVSRDYYGSQFFMSLDQAGPWYEFNPEKAKQLLAEAGYAKGFSTQINFYSGIGLYQDYNLYFQAQWKKHLNIEAKINLTDRVAYNNMLYSSSWTGVMNTSACWITSCWGTADDTFGLFVTGAPQNFAKISDPKIDELNRKQRGELDPAKRRQLLWEFEQYELDQIYLFRVGVATAWILMQPWEMNGASHETMWFTGLNGPTWIGMHDTSKYPSNRPKD
jgi:peptide/nickel transport system substrate-binding protein